MTKDKLISVLEQRIHDDFICGTVEPDTRLKQMFETRRGRLVLLSGAVRNHPFEDVSAFFVEYQDILAGKGVDVPVTGEQTRELVEAAKRKRLSLKNIPTKAPVRVPTDVQPFYPSNPMASFPSSGAYKNAYTDLEQTFMGMGPVAVPAGSSVLITARPQITFKPTRMAIDPSIAPFFLINDAKIGNVSMYVDSGPISAVFFPPLPGFQEFETKEELELAARVLSVDWPTCQISQQFSLSVTNVGTVGQTFLACLWGRVSS